MQDSISLQDSPGILARHARSPRFTFRVWKVDRFVRKWTDNLSPEEKGPSRGPRCSPSVAQADVRRWVLTLRCNRDSEESHDCVFLYLSSSCFTGAETSALLGKGQRRGEEKGVEGSTGSGLQPLHFALHLY